MDEEQSGSMECWVVRMAQAEPMHSIPLSSFFPALGLCSVCREFVYLEDSAEISLFGIHPSHCRGDWFPWRRLSSSSLVDNNYLDSGITSEWKSLNNFAVAVQFLPLLSLSPLFLMETLILRAPCHFYFWDLAFSALFWLSLNSFLLSAWSGSGACSR